MSDLIDRNATINAAMKKCDELGTIYLSFSEISDVLNEQPTIQQERTANLSAYNSKAGLYCCNECATFVSFDSNYCFNCGAKFTQEEPNES